MNAQNRVNISTLLQQHQAVASQPAQRALVDFAYNYTKKLINKCIEVGNLKGHLSQEDIKYVYEVQNSIYSPVMEGEFIDRKTKTIQAINKVALKDLQPNAEDQNNTTPLLSTFQTVRIGNQSYSGFPTAQNFQISYQNTPN